MQATFTLACFVLHNMWIFEGIADVLTEGVQIFFFSCANLEEDNSYRKKKPRASNRGPAVPRPRGDLQDSAEDKRR
jgi:hypothetical protein